MVSYDDGNVLLKLVDDSLPAGVTIDDSFLLTVTACSDITCRTSKSVVFSKCVYHEKNRVYNYLGGGGGREEPPPRTRNVDSLTHRNSSSTPGQHIRL